MTTNYIIQMKRVNKQMDMHVCRYVYTAYIDAHICRYAHTYVCDVLIHKYIVRTFTCVHPHIRMYLHRGDASNIHTHTYDLLRNLIG